MELKTAEDSDDGKVEIYFRDIGEIIWNHNVSVEVKDSVFE